MEVSAFLYGWDWSIDDIKAGFIETEELGFDGNYLADDLFPHPPHEDATVVEPWSVLPILADITGKMRIGTLVTCAGRRHPALLAKMAACVDQSSHGRLMVGMGSGNIPEQFGSWGKTYMKAPVRSKMLREELEVMRLLWTEKRANFEGEYYTLKDAICSPKPVQKPYPEILIGLGNKTPLPPVAAEYADRVNILRGPDSIVREILDTLEEECKKIGRDFNSIKKQRIVAVTLTSDENLIGNFEAVCEQRARLYGTSGNHLINEFFNDRLPTYVGPAEGCAEALKKRSADVGFDEIVVVIGAMGFLNSFEEEMSGLREFARDVLPDLKKI